MVPYTSCLVWCGLKGVRIGEARKPGPSLQLNVSEADVWGEKSQPDDAVDGPWAAALARHAIARVEAGPPCDLDDPEGDLLEEEDEEDVPGWRLVEEHDADAQPGGHDESSLPGRDEDCNADAAVMIGLTAQHREVWELAEQRAQLTSQKHGPPRGKSAQNTVRGKVLCRPCPTIAIDGYIPCGSFAGHLEGFVFKTSEARLGYYADAAALAASPLRTTLVLAKLVPPPSDDARGDSVVVLSDQLQPGHGRARRARGPDGRRILRPSRRKRATQCQGQQAVRCATTSLLGERWWPKHGLWAIDTANANSWMTFEGAVLSKSCADVLLGQESKILTADRLRSAETVARGQGWNPTLSLAHRTAADRGSGGASVMVRRGSGITGMTDTLIQEGMRHRICISWVDAIVRGGVHCVSIWLRDSEGISPANMALLDELAVALGSLRGPWIIGGDWNLTPEVLSASRWPEVVEGTIAATGLHTCNSSVYDFFVVHRSLTHAVVGVQRLEDAGMSPHWASRLILRGDARRHMVRELVKPPRVDGALPQGPGAQPPSYEHVELLAACRGTLDMAMEAWYKAARAEWSSLAGQALDYRKPRFRWVSAAGPTAKPRPGSPHASATWRSLAKRAQDLIKMMLESNGALSGTKAVVMRGHLGAAQKAAMSLSNSQRETAGRKMLSWGSSLAAAVRTSSVQWIRSLSSVAEIHAKQLEALALNTRRAEWRALVGGSDAKPNALASPSKLAHRWVKGLAGWQHSPVGDIQQNDAIPCDQDNGELEDEMLVQHAVTSRCQQVPLADQAAVEKQADDWVRLWKTDEPYRMPNFPRSPEHLQTLLPSALKMAASSFPLGTGLGGDNISPRAILRLSDEAISALVVLLTAFEGLGQWASALDLVLIVLLPKSDGGFRPIGLFPTVVRLWMRARVYVARLWEAANSLPSLFGGTGMGAQRASWEAAFVAEMAALQRIDHVQFLLDLVKAFETIPHDKLAEAANAKGYSLSLLRLSIAAYRLRRSIGVAGVFSRCMRATRGITAGSGFATSELRLILLDTMLELQKRWSTQISVKLYVDDLTLSASGLPGTVLRLMVAVMDFVTKKIEHGLGLEISAKKSVAVAGRPSLAAATVHAIRQSKVRAVRQGKLLGTDSTGGRRRSTRTFKVRLHQFSKTIHRFHALRDVGVNTKQMVRAAGPPAILYGCETLGVSDSALQVTRSRVAAAAAPQAGGKNPDATLYALDGASGTLDPAFLAHASPIVHWAMAWWEGWFRQADLTLAFRIAVRKIGSCKSSAWSRVTGPVGAMIASLRRLGWTSESACEVTDDRSNKWHFNRDAPAAIAAAVRLSVRRWRLGRLDAALPGLVPRHCDVGAPACPEGTVLVNFAAELGQLLSSRRTSKQSDGWSPKWRGDLASAVSGGQWPQARKAAVPSWNITDNRCQLCHCDVGTLEHRFRCPATRPAEGWPAPPAQAAVALSRLSPTRRRLLQTRAMLVLRLPRPPPNRTEWFTWHVEPPECLGQCTWYLDGSMLSGNFGEYRAVGFAIVVVSVTKELLAYGHGCPPVWCSTAAAAEAWALSEALALCPFPPFMKTDCLALLHTAEGGLASATAANRPLARIWNRIGNAMDGNISRLRSDGLLVWVPAHQSSAAIGIKVLSNGDKLSDVDWRANRLADALAKQAASQRQAPVAILRILESGRAAVRHAASLLGRVTQAANNCQLAVVLPDGSQQLRACRDAQQHICQRRRASRPKPLAAVSGKTSAS